MNKVELRIGLRILDHSSPTKTVIIGVSIIGSLGYLLIDTAFSSTGPFDQSEIILLVRLIRVEIIELWIRLIRVEIIENARRRKKLIIQTWCLITMKIESEESGFSKFPIISLFFVRCHKIQTQT